MSFWKRFFGIPTHEYVPVRTKEKAESMLAKGNCPECGALDCIIMGPEGGSATNCMCTKCRHEWNLFLMNGVTILDDLGTASESRARSLYGWTPDDQRPAEAQG